MPDAKNQVARPSGAEDLPDGFSARSVAGRDGVTLAFGKGKTATVPEAALPDVARALKSFFSSGPFRLDPAMSLTLTDEFSGRKASLPASALAGLGAVMGTLVRPTAGAQAKMAAAPSKKAAPPAKAASAPKPGAKPKGPSKAKPSAEAKPAAPEPAAAPEAQAAPKPRKTVVRTPKPAPQFAGSEQPSWFRSLDESYPIEDGAASMTKARLSVNKDNPREVLGVAKNGEGPAMWGFEVLHRGKHAAWVVAEDERSFVITGVPDYKPSVHRIVDGVIARLEVTVLPKLAA